MDLMATNDVTGQVKVKKYGHLRPVHTLVAGIRQTVYNGLNSGQTTLKYILNLLILEYLTCTSTLDVKARSRNITKF